MKETDEHSTIACEEKSPWSKGEEEYIEGKKR